MRPARGRAIGVSGRPMQRARVVIVGAGFAGLNVARGLEGAPCEVVLVDRHNFHTFQPLLYQVATAGLNAADVAYPVRGIFRRQRNLTFRKATVTGVDADARELLLASGDRLRYDHLVVCAGASTNYFGVNGAPEHAFPLYRLADAVRLRNHVLGSFEAAEADPALIDRGALTFVVVGGGPTGVEVAGALVELFETVLRKDYRRAHPGRARVVLVEMLDTVLPPFAEGSQRHALETLRSRGVEVRLGEAVEGVRPDGVRFASGEELPTRTVVWAAGVQASPLAERLGFERTKGGRIVVEPDLSVPGRPEVFVAGDLAAARGPEGEMYPQLAPVAIQAGDHVAEAIRRRGRGAPAEPFVYRDKGVMATIGRRAAVAELPSGIRLRGTIGWLAWLLLHLVMLIGFRNRVSVLVNWAWNYLVWDRGPRLILEPEEAVPGEDPETDLRS